MHKDDDALFACIPHESEGIIPSTKNCFLTTEKENYFYDQLSWKNIVPTILATYDTLWFNIVERDQTVIALTKEMYLFDLSDDTVLFGTCTYRF